MKSEFNQEDFDKFLNTTSSENVYEYIILNLNS